MATAEPHADTVLTAASWMATRYGAPTLLNRVGIVRFHTLLDAA